MNVTDVDAELELDPTTDAAVRRLLSGMVGATDVADDAWDKITARTSAPPARPFRRGRRRLLVAAAAVLLLVGGVVADEDDDDDRDRVRTDDTPSTTVDDTKDFDDRRPDDQDPDLDTPDVQGPDTELEREPAQFAPGSSPSEGAGSESAAPGLSPSLPGAPSPAPGAVVPRPSPASTTSTTTPPTTTTTTPPPRLPGDITLATSSGFSVEVLLTEDADGHLGNGFLRRSDSQFDGDFWLTPDRYVPLSVSSYHPSYTESPAESGNYTQHLFRGARCVSASQTIDHPSAAPHDFAWGVVGSEIAEVRVVLFDGTTLVPQVATRVVGDGFRAWLAEIPSGVSRVEGIDTAGQPFAAYADCSEDHPGVGPPPM
ncbi:MAG: hypothetical protein ACRDZN_07210 [Acidimicrobiales bacterium]